MLSAPQHTPRRARHSESGSIVILTALVMVVVLGIVAFAVDASFLYTERNRMSAAADAAAKSAAIENQRGIVDLQPFADREVALHGFDPGVTTTVSVDRPSVGYVGVTLSRPTNTFFAKIINAAFETITLGARAVAGVAAPQNCVVTTHDLNLVNSATASLNGCDMAVGGNLRTDSAIGGTPTPGVSAGTCTGSCVDVATTDQPLPGDPLASLPSPGAAGYVGGVGCPGGIPAGPTNPLPGGCYTSIPDTVRNLQSDAAFQVSGPIAVNSTLSGSGVLLYLTGSGAIQATGNATLNLTAPTSGPYQGIALYGDPGATIDLSGVTQFTLDVGGVVYMPSADLNSTQRVTVSDIGGCMMLFFNNYYSSRGSITASTSTCLASYPQAKFLGVALAE